MSEERRGTDSSDSGVALLEVAATPVSEEGWALVFRCLPKNDGIAETICSTMSERDGGRTGYQRWDDREVI